MASGQDITSATGTYGGFVTLIKWGAIISAILVAFVVLLIS
jgi:hypothetical protein